MCGIVGYAGSDPACPVLASGLENLEYRGYDSAGVALTDDAVTVYKRAGDVATLTDALPTESTQRCGIGHTRWSTHGPPTDANAHPHTDDTERVAVVHNGIIENHDTLREELQAAGHTFDSDTDTEVIPHLIADALNSGADPRAAIRDAIDQLDGSFAIVVTIAGVDSIFAVRRDSPLLVGHGDDEMLLASDATAFLERTRDVTYLDDDVIAVVDADGLTCYRTHEPIEYTVETLEGDATAAEKGGYDHYMAKEIHEQPTALRRTISGRLDIEAGAVDLDIELPAAYLDSLEEIQIVACGTSYYAGVYAATLLETYADVRTSVEIASEYEFRGGRDPWRTLVIAVTQSGETADTLSAIRAADRAGAKTLAVTNTLGSTVTREVDTSLFIRAGPEIGVAATKTFASQVATLTLLTVYLGRRRQTLSADAAADILSSVQALPGAIQQVLDRTAHVEDVAAEYADSTAFFFIGRRLGKPVALEGALKLKEIAYDHAEGFAAGELKHGPLALVTEDTPVIAVLTDGATARKTINNTTEVQTRGAPVIAAVTDDDDSAVDVDVALPVPDIGVLEPLVANVYWQLFAYYVAKGKGRPIDKPRNLAKSVTVE